MWFDKQADYDRLRNPKITTTNDTNAPLRHPKITTTKDNKDNKDNNNNRPL